ncbi:hypothetical protein pkur_cds_81 [Pandoravirus kuranda]|uniref:F-box domain containing protein n=1 Tax=Pandoravirus kuranda TaxID=3019033 RepID=A0AA95EBY1_9VIRU|nr:hypothetical protein pkur_cds_81 [Pandoravirus kuranda]
MTTLLDLPPEVICLVLAQLDRHVDVAAAGATCSFMHAIYGTAKRERMHADRMAVRASMDDFVDAWEAISFDWGDSPVEWRLKQADARVRARATADSDATDGRAHRDARCCYRSRPTSGADAQPYGACTLRPDWSLHGTLPDGTRDFVCDGCARVVGAHLDDSHHAKWPMVRVHLDDPHVWTSQGLGVPAAYVATPRVDAIRIPHDMEAWIDPVATKRLDDDMDRAMQLLDIEYGAADGPCYDNYESYGDNDAYDARAVASLGVMPRTIVQEDTGYDDSDDGESLGSDDDVDYRVDVGGTTDGPLLDAHALMSLVDSFEKRTAAARCRAPLPPPLPHAPLKTPGDNSGDDETVRDIVNICDGRGGGDGGADADNGDHDGDGFTSTQSDDNGTVDDIRGGDANGDVAISGIYYDGREEYNDDDNEAYGLGENCAVGEITLDTKRSARRHDPFRHLPHCGRYGWCVGALHAPLVRIYNAATPMMGNLRAWLPIGMTRGRYRQAHRGAITRFVLVCCDPASPLWGAAMAVKSVTDRWPCISWIPAADNVGAALAVYRRAVHDPHGPMTLREGFVHWLCTARRMPDPVKWSARRSNAISRGEPALPGWIGFPRF